MNRLYRSLKVVVEQIYGSMTLSTRYSERKKFIYSIIRYAIFIKMKLNTPQALSLQMMKISRINWIVFSIFKNLESTSKVSPHFFLLNHVFKLYNINLIRLYTYIVEIEYYIYINKFNTKNSWIWNTIRKTNFSRKKKMTEKKTKW